MRKKINAARSLMVGAAVGIVAVLFDAHDGNRAKSMWLGF